MDRVTILVDQSERLGRIAYKIISEERGKGERADRVANIAADHIQRVMRMRSLLKKSELRRMKNIILKMRGLFDQLDAWEEGTQQDDE